MHVPLKDLMYEMRSLEPFPGVAARVLEVAGRDEVVPSELIELVQTDPGITSKVLKLCNSAYYGFQREIAALHEAGNLRGVTTLVNLVLTSSAGKYFRDYGSAKGHSMESRWEQCVSNAIGRSTDRRDDTGRSTLTGPTPPVCSRTSGTWSSTASSMRRSTRSAAWP